MRTSISELPSRFRLDGKMAVITGAGRGIGRACAIALSEAGADLTIISRNREELSEVAAIAESHGSEVHVHKCDVTDPHQFLPLFSASPKIDILVNCAGRNIPEPFLDVSQEHLDQLLDLNVRSVILMTQAVVGNMIDAGRGGAIVTMSSQMGHVGAENRTIYCATKHAVEGFTKALAVEVAKHGIRVNTVSPTFIDTAMTHSYLNNEDNLKEIVSQIPLGRIGQVDEVVGAVLYLVSRASSLTTGTSILVDGGWTAK